MASRKDTILKAAKRTAKQAHAAASKRGHKSKTRVNIEPHRHCSVCWKPISLESDPAICDDDGCSTMYERREKSRKRFTFLMYFGIVIFVGLLAFQVIMGASG
jgi:predicted nucleic acid-binding Zn ribbon protein